MDPKQLLEMTEQYKKFTDKIVEIKKNYGDKMEELKKKMDTLNEKADNTEQYLEIERKKITAKIDEIKAAMEKKVQEVTKQVEDWMMTQKERLQNEFEMMVKSKLGII
jgi:vacuolar-type H+-ATPase subunit I/STV1